MTAPRCRRRSSSTRSHSSQRSRSAEVLGGLRRRADGRRCRRLTVLAGMAVGRDKRQVHHPRGRAERARRTQDRHCPRADLCRRAASPLKLVGEGQSFHVLDPAVRVQGDCDADRCGHLGRRLHPAERLCRCHHDAARRSRIGDGFHYRNDPRRTSRFWRSTRPSEEDEEGKKVKVGDTATLELTPQQAEIITVAQQMADRLTLALRSVADAPVPPPRGRLSSSAAAGVEPCASSNPAKFPKWEQGNELKDGADGQSGRTQCSHEDAQAASAGGGSSAPS